MNWQIKKAPHCVYSAGPTYLMKHFTQHSYCEVKDNRNVHDFIKNTF